MSDSKKRLLNDKEDNKPVFLIPAQSDIEQYVCEDCDVRLVLYPQARIDNPHAGTSYICPKCHCITDSSLRGMQREDQIKPFDLAPPSFGIVQEDKDWSKRLFGNYYNVNDHDPEPQEDDMIRAKGGKIIESKIEAKNDYI